MFVKGDMTPVNYPQQPGNVDYMNNSPIQCPLLPSCLKPVHKITADTKEEKICSNCKSLMF